MGDGTEQNPFTCEDVLRLIKEHRGTENLDLSLKIFEDGVNLSGLNLDGIILDKALMNKANLRHTSLKFAKLQGTFLWEADLRGAILAGAKLQGANLRHCKLNGAHLPLCEISQETNLEHVEWGDYILEDEKMNPFFAADTYRTLKIWHTNAGMYDIAGEFFYREMAARRKGFWLGESRRKPLREFFHPPKPKEILRILFPRKPFRWAWSMLANLLCGYGERPLRTVISAVVVVFGLAVIYFFLGAFSPGTFLGCLYYSVVSFTALGYGSWVYPEPESWAKGLGAAEAIVGVFTIALFLVTFVRKMTR